MLCQVDRPSVTEQQCNEVQSNLFDLFAHLGATDDQLDFTTLYASAREVSAKGGPFCVRSEVQMTSNKSTQTQDLTGHWTWAKLHTTGILSPMYAVHVTPSARSGSKC